MKQGRNRKRRVNRVLFGAGLVALSLYGCGSSSEEQLRAAELAGNCSLNSECKDPLICAFARCHNACDEDRDCPVGLRCVHGDAESGKLNENVCQLERELTCEADKDCPGDQVCGIDEECRDACDADQDCIATQLCANSGECASTDPEHDHVDENGNIVADGEGGAAGSPGSGGRGSGGRAGSGAAGGGHAGMAQPSSGSAGDGGESGSAGEGGAGRGGTEQSGGGSGEGAAPGDAGDSNSGGTAGNGGGGAGAGGSSGGGQGGTAGSAGSGGTAGNAGAGGGPFEDLTETSDGIETIDNDTRENAVPLTTRATINLQGSDHDWFVVTPPLDGKTHILSLQVEQDANLSSALEIQAAADHSVIGQPRFSLGVTSFAYVTAAPNTTLHFDFSRIAITGTMGNAHITLGIVPENDAYEPNNDSDHPAEIELDVPIYGQVLNPYATDIDNLSQDWFALELAQGTATLTFLQNPNEARIQVRRLSSTNQDSPIDITGSGEIPSFQFSVSEAGRYRILLEPYADSVDSFSQGAKPTYLDEQYAFVISQ